MSVKYRLISWNRTKKAYDTSIAAGLAVYLGLFVGLGFAVHPDATIETLLIRALATAAFLMLHLILSIGPLCRMNPAFRGTKRSDGSGYLHPVRRLEVRY